MSLNTTPSSERVHIGFFGRRNAGKSSVVNAVTGQELSVVSEIKGTTTDPVYKSMELLPIGPVVIIDTPGFDDEGALGEQRVKKSRQVLNKTDLAVLVIDATLGMSKEDEELIELFREKEISYLIVYNKSDIAGISGEAGRASIADMSGVAGEAGRAGAADIAGVSGEAGRASIADMSGVAGEVGRASIADMSGVADISDTSGITGTVDISSISSVAGISGDDLRTEPKTAHSDVNSGMEINVSAKNGHNINELKEMITAMAVTEEPKLRIVGDIIKPSDFVVLVVPIDKAAPKGRLILPQQQTIRDILDSGAVSIVVKDIELAETLAALGKKPALVITDSQVFSRVSAETPENIPLTSFSILFARYKGNLADAVKGAKALDSLKDRDTVLISEGCTHHRQCGDIGTVKLPKWIERYTGKQLNFKFTSGTEFPEDLAGNGLIVHCGGCMLNEREMKYRRKCAADQHVPMTNYGIIIAYMQGILKRSIAMFPELN